MTRILIVAGGTGGHVFPALAIAEQLRRLGAEVAWLGVGGMESGQVGGRGIRLFTVPYRAPRRWRDYGPVLWAVARAAAVLRRVRPAAVLGMGGYPSVAGGLAAWLLRIPLLIHEQNAVAGRANLLLRRFAARILTGFPDVMKNGEWVGTPVREEFAVGAGVKQGYAPAARPQLLRLLILGGSQGAKILNQVAPAAIGGGGFAVLHQCGRGHLTATQKNYAAAGANENSPTIEVREFIDDMAAAMADADFIICRAGASTLSEIAEAGVAALLVPYPHAAFNHQSANARVFECRRAAFVRAEKEFTAEWLADFLRRLEVGKLAAMAANARRLANPAAGRRIAEICLQEAGRAA